MLSLAFLKSNFMESMLKQTLNAIKNLLEKYLARVMPCQDILKILRFRKLEEILKKTIESVAYMKICNSLKMSFVSLLF